MMELQSKCFAERTSFGHFEVCCKRQRRRADRTGLNRKLEGISQEQKQLKTKVCKLEGDLLYKTTQMKAMNIHVERLRVTKRQFIALLMFRSRLNRSGKDAKMISECLVEQYVGISLYIEPIFNALCVKEVAEMQNFSNQPRCKRTFRGDDFTECDIVVARGKLVSPFRRHSFGATRRLFVSSASSDEQSMKE